MESKYTNIKVITVKHIKKLSVHPSLRTRMSTTTLKGNRVQSVGYHLTTYSGLQLLGRVGLQMQSYSRGSVLSKRHLMSTGAVWF